MPTLAMVECNVYDSSFFGALNSLDDGFFVRKPKQVALKLCNELHPKTDHEHPEREYMYSSTLSLTSGLDGVGCQHHALAALPPGKRPGTPCTGGWVGLTAGLDTCGKSRPRRDSIPGPSSPLGVAIPTELSQPIFKLKPNYACVQITISTT